MPTHYTTDPREVISRFWAKIDRRGAHDCWLWTGAKIPAGYGELTIYVDGQPVHMYAHRFAYELANGTIPEGLLIQHSCDVRNCVNPAHLSMGTDKSNIQDAKWKGHFLGRRALKGSAHSNSKLVEADIVVIRSRYAGGESLVDLGREFSVTSSAILAIVKRKTWKHVA